MSRWIGTANRGFAPYAMEELRKLFPGARFQQLAPAEVFLFETEQSDEQTTNTISTNEPVFLRHVQPVYAELPLQGNADDLEALSALVRRSRQQFEDKQIAVHVRRADGTLFPYSAADAKGLLDAVLTEAGAATTLQAPEWIVSVYAAREVLYVGWAQPQEMLSDWPGGAVRFQREEGQISRAKFKLLEAERTFGLQLASYRRALDIGAAPGGWTSLLLERGLQVTAVDPAELHPSLLDHSRLTYLRKKASDVVFPPATFDLIVCDMSWSPLQMSRMVLDLQAAAAPGATAVITVKLMHRKPLQTIREVIARLESAFQLLKAKQLFHNRDEITLLLQRH